MRVRNKLLAAGLGLTLVALASVATAGNSFLGREAPEIKPTAWIGGDWRTSLADYRGEVVLLEFWFTH